MNTKSKTVPFYRVIVIGGGFAGLGAAIKLKQAGIHDFILLEKANELGGGVWRENTYPGCACDVPSALYSYSFEPNPTWSRVFAGQAEIKEYLQNTAKNIKFYRMCISNMKRYQQVGLMQNSAGLLKPIKVNYIHNLRSWHVGQCMSL